jgi:hypothetical protein
MLQYIVQSRNRERQRPKGDLQSLLTVALGQDRDRAASWHDTEQIVPASPHAATVLLDKLLERDAHLLLDDARVVHVTRDAKQLGTLVPFPSERRKPAGSTSTDGGSDSHSLHVGDRGRATEKADVGGERRLETGFALLALERLDERCLLAADVCSSSAMKVDVKVVAGPASILADETSFVRFVDGGLDVGSFLVELSTDVNVSFNQTQKMTGVSTGERGKVD